MEVEELEKEVEQEKADAVRRKQQRFGKNFSERKMSSKCFRCDGEFPNKGTCPAFGKICLKCGKTGHYARCCKSKNPDPRSERGVHEGINPNTKFSGYSRPLNNINTTHLPVQDSDSSDEESNSLFHISNQKDRVDFNTVVRIEQQNVQVLIDTF